jgi:broad specificity phosphatase PhoE
MLAIVFETHSTSEDNEKGVATGWLPGRLSALGREQAAQLGARRATDGIDAVFTSDLARAVQTATIAFAGTPTPILHDWRLRECDYGRLNGSDAAAMRRTQAEYLDVAYPGGESWRQAVARVAGFLDDLPSRWDGGRVLVIGHVATSRALELVLNGVSLETLMATPFEWRDGWEYELPVLSPD